MQNGNPDFALATISAAGGPRFGAIIVGGRALALEAIERFGFDLAGRSSVLGALERWDQNFPILRKAAEAMHAGPQAQLLQELSVPLDAIRFHIPVDRPRQVFCTGANYRGHVRGLLMGDPASRAPGEEHEDATALADRVEKALREKANAAKPYCFIKLPTCLIGPNDPLALPKDVAKPDWELELAVIIGRSARRVPASEAMGYVAGYAIMNDVTARDMVWRRDNNLGTDWLAGKNHPSFAPFGPYFVPAEFVGDPYDLAIRLAVNGRVMQNETTGDMLISIARQIEYLSNVVSLMPGDVISTGSPAGNGAAHGVFLKPGDLMESSITGLGIQHTLCIAE